MPQVETGSRANLVDEIEELTKRMLAEAAADHMKSAIQRELESVQMAKLAVWA